MLKGVLILQFTVCITTPCRSGNMTNKLHNQKTFERAKLVTAMRNPKNTEVLQTSFGGK